MAKAKQIPQLKYRLSILLCALPRTSQLELLRKIEDKGVTGWNLRKIRGVSSNQKWDAKYQDLKIIVEVLMPYNEAFNSSLGITISSVEDIIVSAPKKMPKAKIV